MRYDVLAGTGAAGNRIAGAAAGCVLFFGIALSGTSEAHDGFGDLVEEILPSVVSVYVQAAAAESSAGSDLEITEETPFSEIFRHFREQQENPRQQNRMGAGAGFIISADGHIVTNAHVIMGSEKIIVALLDERRFEAELVGSDRSTDIAVLKIEAGEALPFVSFGNSDALRIGDNVLAVGNPYGLGFSVSSGIVSARGRTLAGPYDDFIQTDAAINSGNSGGPLFDMSGEVVGVNTLYITDGRSSARPGSTGVGFSMASAVVAGVVDQLIEFGATRRGWLGVSLQPLDTDMAEALGRDDNSGALVLQVGDGPAREAGISEGDVITGFNGDAVPGVDEFVRMIADAGSGAEVSIELMRDGEMRTVAVILGSREAAQGESLKPALFNEEPDIGNALGLRLGEAPVQEGRNHVTDSGLLVLDVDESSVAEEKGIRPGDKVLEINFTMVHSLEDVRDSMESAEESGRKSVLVLIARDQTRRYVALPI
ncbi:MAG: trypsin-like peptidase domain-containing protein [Rhodobacteraceae bacterium]|nr:trypsin-like peptidase domain-containing protein [Paracoccaceae bacterium]